MKILIVNQHYWGKRPGINDLAPAMRKWGHVSAALQVGERLESVRREHIDQAGDGMACCNSPLTNKRATLVTKLVQNTAPQGST